MDHEIRNETARRFVAALRTLEQTGDADSLVALYTDEAELSRMGVGGTWTGRAGAAGFWDSYRSVFDRLSSTFLHATEGESAVALEWVGEGTLPDGHPVTYRGATVIDLAGEYVGGTRTYYDSAAFVRPGTA